MNLDAPPIDFLGLARSLGVEANRAETPAEAAALVREGIAAGAPRLIEAVIDPAL
jgi:thiamine pyrophosphate-dependent acetolactate synthase large subunit-like protein